MKAAGVDVTSRLDDEQIRGFWSSQARSHGQSHAASWNDQRVIDLEIAAISRYLEPGHRLLDAGCANGYSTARYAMDIEGLDVTGVDYTPEMIEEAHARHAKLPGDVRERLRFAQGDVTNLAFEDGTFDRVLTTRVLISLTSTDLQRAALAECVRVCRPGGKVLLSEASEQAWERLNALRGELGMEAIPMPGFNTYLDEDGLFAHLPAGVTLERVVDFSSSYFVATRVVKPLLASMFPESMDVANPDSHINRWASMLPSAGDYGTQRLFVLALEA